MTRKWLVLAAIACGTFMGTLDSSVVNIALPTITQDLATDLSVTRWVVMIYLFVVTFLILPFGQLADLHNRRLIYVTGFAVFTAGSALCGYAHSLGLLITGRAIQGVGAALLMSNGPAIITSHFPAPERGKALGVLAMAVSAGLILGPSFGGFIIESLGWRTIFLLNIPFGILGLALVHRNIIPQRQRRAQGQFDWAGAFLQFACFAVFVLLVDPPSIVVIGADRWPIPRWVLGAVLALLALIFIKTEAQCKAPLLDFSLFKVWSYWVGLISCLLFFVSFSFVSVLMPFFLEGALGLSIHRVGLMMTAVPLSVLVVAPLSGRLSDKYGSRELCVLGCFFLAFPLFSMASNGIIGVDTDSPHRLITFYLCLIGTGLGLFQSPNNNSMMGEIPGDKLGVASALLGTVRNLALVLGAALATTVYSWRLKSTADAVSTIHFAFWISGIFALLAAIASLLKKTGPYWRGR